MSGLNKVQLIGNLGRDPETRRTTNGDPVVTFSVAVNETWKDKETGEKRERVEWANVVIWNEGLGKIAEQYLKKGSRAYIEGQMQTRKYTDKDGVERYTTEVVLQRFRGELLLLGDASASGTRPPPPDEERPGARPAGERQSAPPLSDDIPFRFEDR